MNMPPPPMVAEVILEEKGLSRGRCPVSRFPWMEKCVKLFRFSTHRGNSPDSWLFPSDNLCRLESCPSSDGIGPVSPLLSSCSCVRLARFASSDGIGSERLLELSHRCVRLDRLPSSDGIGPERLLELRYRCVRLDRLPSSDGIGPERLLELRYRCVRLGRFPSWGGTVPFICRRKRKIWVTRRGVPVTVTPVQLISSVDAFQLRRAGTPRVSFSPQRTLQSATSPVFV